MTTRPLIIRYPLIVYEEMFRAAVPTSTGWKLPIDARHLSFLNIIRGHGFLTDCEVFGGRDIGYDDEWYLMLRTPRQSPPFFAGEVRVLLLKNTNSPLQMFRLRVARPYGHTRGTLEEYGVLRHLVPVHALPDVSRHRRGF